MMMDTKYIYMINFLVFFTNYWLDLYVLFGNNMTGSFSIHFWHCHTFKPFVKLTVHSRTKYVNLFILKAHVRDMGCVCVHFCLCMLIQMVAFKMNLSR